ncbi:MAG: redoxin domain-containing protein [Calditrichaeota bacterium]|nr:redoxin domain-containing protein [Calditrichota bacterium]
MPDYADKSVKFVSVNTRDPKGQVKAEIKRYKINYPVHLGRGQKITEKFKVMKLPRLILIKSDGTIYKDVMFMKAKELKAEIDMLLAEVPVPSEETPDVPESDNASEEMKK